MTKELTITAKKKPTGQRELLLNFQTKGEKFVYDCQESKTINNSNTLLEITYYFKKEGVTTDVFFGHPDLESLSNIESTFENSKNIKIIIYINNKKAGEGLVGVEDTAIIILEESEAPDQVRGDLEDFFNS